MPATVRSTRAFEGREDIGALIPDMMGGWLNMAVANTRAMQSEWASFLARRLEHDRVMMQRFAGCRDLMEAARVQQDWMAEATGAYLEEGRRIAAIAFESTKARTGLGRLSEVA